MNFTDTHIIILAAGSGSRFGSSLPKQFCLLDNKPVLMHTINNLRHSAPGASMNLVLSETMHSFWTELCSRHGFDSPGIVYGGASRFESTRNAILALPPDCRIVMVHDGARPFPTPGMLTELKEALLSEDCQGAIPVVPVTDSLRKIADDGSSQSVDRSQFKAVQTPQAFPVGLLKEAFKKADTELNRFTDDASVMEAAGFGNFTLTAGDVKNIKITNPADLAIAHLYLS